MNARIKSIESSSARKIDMHLPVGNGYVAGSHGARADTGRVAYICAPSEI